MGNVKSRHRLKPKSITELVDYIAANYIFTSDFRSLQNLQRSDYCNRIIAVTTDLLDKNFNQIELEGLAKSKHIYYVRKDDVSSVDARQSKRTLCADISKFYVQIAHIFSAILTTLNPVYVFEDASGNRDHVFLADKAHIPKDARNKRLEYWNLCDYRIRALSRGIDIAKDADDDTNAIPHRIAPKLCYESERATDGHSLGREFGIPELAELYYDADYDVDRGKFRGMSDENKRVYLEDLTLFYRAFTDSPDAELPANVQSFRDIRVTDFAKPRRACNVITPTTETKPLFAQYATQLRKMLHNSRKNRDELLDILTELFVYTTNDDGSHAVKVRPDVTPERLVELTNISRNIIVKLYLTCETDFQIAVDIYEAIQERVIHNTTLGQIRHLDELKDFMKHG